VEYRLERFGRADACIYLINARGSCTQWGAAKMPDATVIQLSDADWFADLSPWKAPRIEPKGEDFGGGADAYLERLMGRIVDIERENGLTPCRRMLAGYSLAGLFALYAALKTEAFDGVASVSGSLWYEGWMEYLKSARASSRLKSVYLSLGDSEPKTRNPFLACVGDRTQQTFGILKAMGIDARFEWNKGGHFSDVSERIVRGMRALSELTCISYNEKNGRKNGGVHMGFFENNQAALAAFAKLSQEVGARADYVQGGGGNTSVKLQDGQMAIKASGFKLSDIRENEAYAVLDYAALREFYETHESDEFEDVEKAGSERAKALTLTIDGLKALRPSVEAGFHSILDTYVAHSHSVYANLAACSQNAREIVAELAKDAPYSIGFVPYTNPGAKLTFSIRDEIRAVEKATGKRPAVIFMQNHGVIATHDDADECLRIHDDINERAQAYFGAPAFPQPALNGNVSATEGLKARLASGRFGEAELLTNPLYPDQMVFFADTLFLTDDAPAEGKASLKSDGTVEYNMDPGKAIVIEETLTAIVYIIDGIEAKGFEVSTMSGAAQQFIANWESEKYRKSMIR